MVGSVQVSCFDDPVTSFEVSVGDYVEVFTSEKALESGSHDVWICKIRQFSEDKTSFLASWCYTLFDVLGGEPDEVLCDMDAREIFESGDDEDDTWNSIETIYRKVTVQDIRASCSSRTDLGDYYMRMRYSTKHHTFEDLVRPPSSDFKKIYRMLELYCGCGGLGFVEQATEECKIVTTHAVDLDKDAILTYKVNHPNTKTHEIGVETFVKNCKGFERIYKRFCSSSGVSGDDSLGVDLITKVYDLTYLERDDPHVRIPSATGDCLEYISLNEALHSGRINRDDVAAYLINKRSQEPIPMPEDIDIIVGGPPCQGLSGRNRSIDTTNVFCCDRNSEIKHFISAVEFFKPRFAVIENIPEAFSRQNGIYLRYAMLNLVRIGYQARVGILSAAAYGAPQMRFRCFVMAALSGVERLPSFPHPTVNPSENAFRTRLNNLASLAKTCVVGVDSRMSASLPPPTLLWDALEDLPEVDNFEMHESAPYRCPPARPYQFYLRRHEGRDENFQEKVKNCLHIQYKDVAAKIKALDRIIEHNETLEEAKIALGESICTKFGYQKQRVWDMYMEELSESQRRLVEEERKLILLKAGAHLMQIVKDFVPTPRGRCTNQRCIPARLGDLLRISMLPKDGGDFTALPGVVLKNNLYCAGHTHGFRVKRQNGAATVAAHCPAYDPANSGKEINILSAENCESYTAFLPTKDLMIPRWVMGMIQRKVLHPRTVFGRLKRTDIVGTLLTEVQASVGYPVLHPYQNRYITVREAARIQGFPDNYVFVAAERHSSSYDDTSKNLSARYRQIGNAVSPPVASMLGRCILRAICHRETDEPAVIFISDPYMNDAINRMIKAPYHNEIAERDVIIIDFPDESIGADEDEDDEDVQ